MVNVGFKMMGLIAFVMLVYASVIKATGGVEALVDSTVLMLGGSKLGGSGIMISLGLLITMGIGT